MTSEKRLGRDMLGEIALPEKKYWGPHTERARRNFKVAGRPVRQRMIKALALVKKASAAANMELDMLDRKKAVAIMRACDEIVSGCLPGEFPVDALQGGAGTSTNMNLNEVIAVRAGEILSSDEGSKADVHPIEDVNMHQSTNDVFPTALKVAVIEGLRELAPEIERFQGILQRKENEFAEIVKIGRTEMQEAVPMTLGTEFSVLAESIARDRWRTFKCEERVRVVNIGGTAIGTGIGAPRSYIFLVIEKLRELTGYGLCRGENVPDQTANTDSLVEVSGILKANAADIIKIADDLRLMNMMGEISLPAVQAGSSIMPGKVNPVILESVVQGALTVIADDHLIADASSRGTLQINEFQPLIADRLIGAIEKLIVINGMMADHLEGVSADAEKCREYFDRSPALVTAFLPHVGYDKAGELIEGYDASSGQTVREFLETKLGKDLVAKVLDPHALMSLGYR